MTEAELDTLALQSFFTVILTLIGMIICGVVCAKIAIERGRNVFVWSALGFIFTVFALPFVISLGKRHPEIDQRNGGSQTGRASHTSPK